MQYLTLIVLLSIIICCFCEEYVVDALTGAVTIPKSCLHVCKQGACQYQNCESTQCPGGACHFIDCKNPSCAGKIMTLQQARFYSIQYNLHSVYNN